jgi:hypothetical protein
MTMPTDIRRGAVAKPSGITKAHTDRRRFMIVSILGFGACCFDGGALAKSDEMFILDDFSRDDLISTLGTPWRGFSDQVMGGISQETLALTEIAGRRCLRLTGDVRLENNGGFIQMTLDLAPDGRTFDASSYVGVLLTVRGNGEKYGVHLRTPACVRPWQSYRARFVAKPEWREIRLPFDRLEPYRLTEALDINQLRRLGLVAIGRAFYADLAISTVGLYR